MEKSALIVTGIWTAVKAICTLTLVGVVAYKIYLTPMEVSCKNAANVP